MKQLLAISFLFAVSKLTVLGLDLTPVAGYRDLEGVKVPNVKFRDGTYWVSWEPPWPISTGSTSKLVVNPPAHPNSTITWEIQRPIADEKGPPHVESLAEDVTKWAAKLLGVDAGALKLNAANQSPYRLNSCASTEFSFQYVLNNRSFGASISYVDLKETERLFLISIAPLDSFPTIRNAAIASMFSVEWEAAALVKPVGSLSPSP